MASQEPPTSSQAQVSVPSTPVNAHATLPGEIASPAPSGAGKSSSYTPPPSAQQPATRHKTRTPAPSASQLTSPPPTTIALDQTRSQNGMTGQQSSESIAQASPEELRRIVEELGMACQSAKTVAAHYKLQYQMLAMESAEAHERFAVETDMAQRETEVLQATEQQRQSPMPQQNRDLNFRNVHIDVYNSMVSDLHDLKARNGYLETTNMQQRRTLVQQESEIASLNDRVSLMRDRIRESRDQLLRYRRPGPVPESTPSSSFRTPGRQRADTQNAQNQHGFAALLQATDLVSQAAVSATPTPAQRKGHAKNSHSLSSLPQTPLRGRLGPEILSTPSEAHAHQLKTPQTAPVKRTLDFGASIRGRHEQAHESDGTVSATDDSEAETEVPDEPFVANASQRNSHAPRSPVSGRKASHTTSHKGLSQSTISGQIQKAGVDRDAGPRGTKRPRTGSIGLGIAGFRE